ncbi:MAG: hypothetical protein ACTIJ6_03870 [Leucobacter sp.]
MSPFRLSVRALPARSQSSVRPVDPVPVAVPWRVTGRSLGIIEIEHRGTEPAHQVRFALSGAGMLGLSLPSTLWPGERVRVAVRGARTDGAATAHDAMLVMRWFQPDGTELLWPIAIE